MNSLKKSLWVLACLISLCLILASCGKTGTTTTSTTATYEQIRSEVVTFLQAFNTIRNDASSSNLPTSYRGRADLPAWDSAVTVLRAAVNVAISRLAELQPSPLEVASIALFQQGKPNPLEEHGISRPEVTTATLLQQAKTNAQRNLTLLTALQDAVNAKAQDTDDNAQLSANLIAAINALSVIGPSNTSLNRDTEKLMLQYDISDSEVGYLSRGK